jgi:hypothetical protein
MTEQMPYVSTECNKDNCTEYRVVDGFSNEELLAIPTEGKQLSPVALAIIIKRGLEDILPHGYTVGFDPHKN